MVGVDDDVRPQILAAVEERRSISHHSASN